MHATVEWTGKTINDYNKLKDQSDPDGKLRKLNWLKFDLCRQDCLGVWCVLTDTLQWSFLWLFLWWNFKFEMFATFASVWQFSCSVQILYFWRWIKQLTQPRKPCDRSVLLKYLKYHNTIPWQSWQEIQADADSAMHHPATKKRTPQFAIQQVQEGLSLWYFSNFQTTWCSSPQLSASLLSCLLCSAPLLSSPLHSSPLHSSSLLWGSCLETGEVSEAVPAQSSAGRRWNPSASRAWGARCRGDSHLQSHSAWVASLQTAPAVSFHSHFSKVVTSRG